MRKFILLLILILSFQIGFSQRRDIPPTPGNARLQEISKSRSLLLDKFLEKDQLAVMLELDRVMMLEDDDYVALYPIEFWLLSYWLKDYEVILSSCKGLNLDSLKKDELTLRISPQPDYLALKLTEKLLVVKDSLFSQIHAAPATEEEKAFLRLNLDYLLSDNANPGSEQQRLNEMADDFLTRYPNSAYAHFTRNFVRVKYKTTKNGAAYTLYGGKFLFTGNLPFYYTHPTVFGLSMDVVRHNWLYQLNIAFGLNKTKSDIPVNDFVWPKNAKATGGYLNLAIGKYVVDNVKFAFAPTAGFGIFGLDPNDDLRERPELKGAGIKTHIAGSLGFVGDLKLNTKKAAERAYFRGVYNTTFLRLSYEFIASPLKNNFVDYSGIVHKITIGIGTSSRKLVRSL